MLRIYTHSSAAALQQYFADHLMTGDYYHEQGHSKGQWLGRGAAMLGLAGKEVSGEDFAALSENRDPRSGDQLTVRSRENRRIAFDFTFAPSKSVSLVFALGDGRIKDLFAEAVTETFQEMEQDAATRVRKGDSNADRNTGNLVGSLYLHEETRPSREDGKPDPMLHAHLVTFSATFDPVEKRWKSLQPHDLFRDSAYYTAAYQSRLAAKLTKLGYQVERRGNAVEIVGIPEELRHKFSRRTVEIDRRAEELGITSKEALGELGAKTRTGKGVPLSPDALRTYWRSRLSGEEAETIRQVIAKASASSQQGISSHALSPERTGSERRITPEQAVRFAADSLLEREGAVPEKQLRSEALRYSFGSVTPEELPRAYEGAGILSREIQGRVYVTTRAVQQEQLQAVQFAREGRGTRKRFADPATYQPPQNLAPDQAMALRHLLGSRDAVMLLDGRAGTGKTRLLQSLKAEVEQGGNSVYAIAPTASAVEVLKTEGFAAQTLAHLLLSDKMQNEVAGNLLLVDEAGLLPSKDLTRLLDYASRTHTRVLLIGDDSQHGPTPRGGGTLTLLREHAGLKPAVLHDVKRQQSNDYKHAVEALAQGELESGMDRLDRLGWIIETPDMEARHRQLAKAYTDTVSEGNSALIIAPTRREGDQLARAVRHELRDRGHITGPDQTLTRLRTTGMTEAERRDARFYERGQVVQFSHSAKGFGRGTRAEIDTVEGERVLVRLADGTKKALPLTQADRFDVYQRDRIELAAGDQIRLTRGGRDASKKQLNNGSIFDVTGFTPEGDLIAKAVTNQEVRIIPKSFGHLTYGTLTSVASQGKGASHVLISQSVESGRAASPEQLYVSASRGKQKATLFVDDKQQLLEHLLREQRRVRPTALDVFPPSTQTMLTPPGLGPRQRRLYRTSVWREYLDRAREFFGQKPRDQQQERTHAAPRFR